MVAAAAGGGGGGGEDAIVAATTRAIAALLDAVAVNATAASKRSLLLLTVSNLTADRLAEDGPTLEPRFSLAGAASPALVEAGAFAAPGLTHPAYPHAPGGCPPPRR